MISKGWANLMDTLWKDDYLDKDFSIYTDFFSHTQRQKEALMSAAEVEFNKFKTDVDRLLVGMIGMSSPLCVFSARAWVLNLCFFSASEPYKRLVV